jgi:hypothetical protein
MEGGGYSSAESKMSFVQLSNIGKYESVDELATIANAGFFTMILTIISARIGGLGGLPMNLYFEMFGLEGIISCVMLTTILFQISRYFYTRLYGTYDRAWSPFVFICFLIGAQVLYDLIFYYGVVANMKKGQNDVIDLIRAYSNENGWKAVAGHSVFVIVTALVAMILCDSSDLAKLILFGVLAFSIPYVISIPFVKPAPPPPPPKKEEVQRNPRGFY